MNRNVYIFFGVLIAVFSSAQQMIPQVSLLTCSPGKEIYSIYGHNAIRIKDMTTGTDYVYNYGTFDFDTPGFALKFMQGKLPYLLSVVGFDRFLMEYNYLQRDVSEQVLNLDSTATFRIINYLAENYKPENRAYAYDFFYDNCATRLRDVIEYGFENDVNWYKWKESQKTFRQIIKEYQNVWPWLNFGVDLIIGAKADKIADERQVMFIPDYLATSVNQAKIKDGILLKRSANILSFDRKIRHGLVYYLINPISIFILLFLLELNLFYKHLTKRVPNRTVRIWDKTWWILLCVSFTVMSFMWFGTDHLATKNNWNILWTIPGLFLFLPTVLIQKHNRMIWFFSILLLLICLVNAMPAVQFLQQYFHPAIIFICAITILKLHRKCYDKTSSQHV